MPNEIQPLETRSAGQGLATCANMLMTFVIGQSFLSMLCTMQVLPSLLFCWPQHHDILVSDCKTHEDPPDNPLSRARSVLLIALPPLLCWQQSDPTLHVQYGIMLFFAAWCVIMTLYIILCLPETKGVPIEEIVVVWRKHWLWKRCVAPAAVDMNGGEHERNEGSQPSVPV